MIMKWFKNLFKKKKKSYNKENSYKLLIIDEHAEFLHETLGITEERASELTTVAFKAYEKHDRMYLCLEDIVSNCKHTNEIVFATMLVDKIEQQQKMKKKMFNAFTDLFGYE